MKKKSSTVMATFARLHNAYNMGLLEPEVLRLAQDWCDFVMRLEGGQFNHAVEFLEKEKKRTHGFADNRTLAGDDRGYKVIQLLAILTHPCQQCAVDPKAWHTRAAFCTHKKGE